jgi:opacity protein-like surface antigen
MVQARWLLVSLLLLCGTLTWSQDSPSRFQVFGGYSYTPTNFSFLGGGENGWNAALDINSRKLVGFTADFAQYFSTFSFGGGIPNDSSKTYTSLFGPRISVPLFRAPKVMPFGHFLIGAAHIHDSSAGDFSTSTSFAWAFGGGVDFSLTRHLSLRGEGDYLHNHFVTGDNQLQTRVADCHGRISTGVVFRF